jgi:hypothetical protein
MDAAGRLLPGAVETVVRDEFGVSGYNLHLNFFLTRMPVYGRRIAVRFRFNSAIGPIGTHKTYKSYRRSYCGIEPTGMVFAFLAGFRGSILAGHQPAIWSGIDTYQLALAMVRGKLSFG